MHNTVIHLIKDLLNRINKTRQLCIVQLYLLSRSFMDVILMMSSETATSFSGTSQTEQGPGSEETCQKTHELQE